MLKKFAAILSAFLLTLLPMGGMVSAAVTTNPISNPSAETGTTTPTGWSESSWDGSGTGADFTKSFQYVSGDAHQGSKSMKVTVSGYDRTYTAGEGGIGGSITGDAGDAKWVFNPLAVGTGAGQLEAGKQYRVTFWYKAQAGVIPKVVSMACLDSAATCENATFFGMPNPVPAANSDTVWTKYTDTFSVPTAAKGVSVFAFIDQNGWIQTDDYTIENYTPTGFSEPLLSLTYDDGHEDNVTNLLPLLNKPEYSNIKTTQCFETATILADPAQSQSNVKAFQNAGHEICSHTINHPMLTQINSTQLAKELTESKSYLQQITGTTVSDFASPYGDYNAQVNAAIKAAGYASHRTVDEGYNSKDNFDAYRLRVQNIGPDTTAAQVTQWINQAKQDKTWLIFVYHRVVDTTKAGQAGYEAPGAFDTTKDLMEQHLAAIKASGIKVATMHDALAETEAQLNPTTPPADTTAPVVSNVTVTGTTANSTTISWTTDEASTATVNYGTSASYGQSVNVTTSGTTHSVTLTGLTASTNYQYQIVAKDAANNSNSATTGSFGTLAVVTPGKFGDITKDGVVNDDDATILFANWGNAPKAGDLDNNGVVNDDDATLLFANWSK